MEKKGWAGMSRSVVSSTEWAEIRKKMQFKEKLPISLFNSKAKINSIEEFRKVL